MTRKWLAIAIVVLVSVSLVGCVTESGYYSPEQSAGAGALGGAATGAAIGSIIGAATGSPATGAWVGAAAGGVLGAVGGYLYAEHRNSQISQSRAAATYTPAQGNVVSVDTAYATPSLVRGGQQVNLRMNYTVLNPGNTATTTTLVREVRYRGQLVGQPYQATVSNYNGTYSDSVAYALPSNASPGTYTVTSRVDTAYGSSQRDSFFTVE